MRLGARPIAALAVLCAIALAGCGDTLQDQPIPHDILEGLLVAPRAVYWLGGSFQGMAITEAVRDPGGAYSVRYGDCVRGGQNSCVAPVRIVTSPDNSFLPGGSAPHRSARIRDVAALVAQGGQTIEIPTGAVVIGIYAQSQRLADAAAQTVVPINAVGTPGAPLPPRLPDTRFAMRPLPSQVPPLLRVPR